MIFCVKKQAITWFKKVLRTKKVIKIGRSSGKDDILTVEEKWTYIIVNKTKRILKMTPRKRKLEARRLKATNMWIKKIIEKQKYLLSDNGGKICLRLLQVNNQKVIKRKNW